MKRILGIALLGVLYLSVFSLCTPNVNSKSSGLGQIPPYAFDGAYATYQITANNSIKMEEITYFITNVNETAQSFDLNVSYTTDLGGYSSSWSISRPASFSQPSPFPAVDIADMNNLTIGSIPANVMGGLSNISGAEIKPNVTISVPAGTFSTYEISITNYNYTIGNDTLGIFTFLVNATTWIEANSGMVVETSASLSPPPVEYIEGQAVGNVTSSTWMLEKTNIPLMTSAGVSSGALDIQLYSIIIVVMVAVATIGGYLALKRRKVGKTIEVIPQSPPNPSLPTMKFVDLFSLFIMEPQVNLLFLSHQPQTQ